MAVAKELKAKGVVVELGRRIQSNMAGFWRSRKSASRSDESSQNSSQAKESRKPGNSDFKQQRLKAWQPILTASSVLPVFLVIGLVFLPLGIALLVASDEVQEKIIEYTNCNGCQNIINGKQTVDQSCNCTVSFTLSKKFNGPVYLYYGLSNFYQNHRRYVRSLDPTQLHGNLKTSVSSNCKPFDKVNVIINNQTVSKPVAPCGAIANSLFNDTFMLYRRINSTTRLPVSLSGKNIAWKSDVNDKFKNPSGNIQAAFAPFAKPPFWRKSIVDMTDHFKNEAFIVWMRVAAFPTFRKLHKTTDSLETGSYELDIQYNYPVSPFKGEKRVILSTASWIGGKNPFLGIAYIVVGCICIVCGVVFFVVHLKVRTRSAKSM